MTYYKKLKLTDVINASGRMSILGVSTLSQRVREALDYGGSRYFIMEELHDLAGRELARFTGSEAAFVTNSASSGIVLSVAGLIARGDRRVGRNLFRAEVSREIVLMKGQNVDYGAPVETMVELGGGVVVEAGYANGCSLEDLSLALSERAAGVLFVQSHHAVQKNMPSLEEVNALCRERSVPLIVDAAAEGDLTHYPKLSDLVIYSGSKAIEGPTSGIVAGGRKYVDYVRAHSDGIGRAMKVGKEAILGLLQALADYGGADLTKEDQLQILDQLKGVEELPGVSLSVIQDEAGREIYRGRIKLDEGVSPLSASQVVERLAQGDLAIFTRDYNANLGFFDIDPRPLAEGDAERIVEKLVEIFAE